MLSASMLTFVSWQILTVMMAMSDFNSDGNMDIRTKFDGNPSKSCRDSSLKIINGSLIVALEEMSDHQSHIVI